MAQTQPTARARLVASTMRKLRASAGLSQAEVAKEMGWSKSKQEKLEAGNLGVRPSDARALCSLYGVTDPQRVKDLVDLAKRSRIPGWWSAYGLGAVPGWFEPYISLESEASSLRVYQQELIHGLLQTPEYARSVVRAFAPRATDEEVDQRVDVRMQRQARLEGESPLALWVILNEAALRRPIEERGAWRAQLRYLLERCELPNVSLQVLPFAAGPHASMESSYELMGFPESADLNVLYLEAGQASSYHEDSVIIGQYTDVFDHLRGQALDTRRSSDFVAHVLQEV
ncbi:helix-turn-helix domain-containing protein [Actinomadura harenae]|uniref:helix-turn-helix domain-containing protein n=1 Tax=Actinomadura harenae TaxID=2483351 RepID=UPI00131571CE|nr:helix-turn-helix transcriptional regulator [Actinomadura harenae]